MGINKQGVGHFSNQNRKLDLHYVFIKVSVRHLLFNLERTMKNIILFIAFGAFFMSATLPIETEKNPSDMWKTLGKVTFKMKKDDIMGYDVEVPIFSKTVKALAGKTIEIRGYIIPVEGYKQQGYFVFSAYPYNLCYFCGGAGKETVMEVFTKKNTTIKYTAKPITIKGELVLNSKDVNKLMYLLEDAVIVK